MADLTVQQLDIFWTSAEELLKYFTPSGVEKILSVEDDPLVDPRLLNPEENYDIINI
jgi:hypothetical protein